MRWTDEKGNLKVTGRINQKKVYKVVKEYNKAGNPRFYLYLEKRLPHYGPGCELVPMGCFFSLKAALHQAR